MSHSAASDLGLHCLPITLLGVSRLKGVKVLITSTADDNLILLLSNFSEKIRLGISCESSATMQTIHINCQGLSVC